MSSDPRDPRGGGGSGPSIPVVVKNPGQEPLELEAEPGCTVYGLKCRVAEYWQIPPLCQELVYKTVPLSDSGQLAQYWEGPQSGAELEVMMVISEEGVFTGLQDEDSQIRRMAVMSLSQVAHKDYERALQGLAARLEDPDWEVRRAAVEVLGEVAQRGEHRAIGACWAHLEDRSVSVRRAAVLSLAQLTPKGDAQVIKAVSGLLEDRDDGVRQAVAEALAEMAPRGDELVMKEVAARLEHWSVLVRRAAIEALARVAEKGDERIVTAISAFLRQEPGLIRVAAMMAIGQLAPRGSKTAHMLAMNALEDSDERVQAAAAHMLREAGLAPLDAPSPGKKQSEAPRAHERGYRAADVDPLESAPPIRRVASN